MNKVRFLSRILMAVLILMQIGTAQATTINDLQAKKNAAAQKAKELEQQAQQKAYQADSLSIVVAKITEDISSLEKKIGQNQSSLSNTRKNINQTEKLIEEKQASLEESQKKQVAAIQMIYVMGRRSTIETLLTSDSLSETLSRQQYLNSLEGKIEDITRDIKKTKQELEDKKTSLDKSYSELTSLKKELEIQNAGLQVQKSGQQRLLSDATAEMKRLQNQAAEQSRIEDQVEAQIKAEFVRLTSGGSSGKVAGTKVNKGDIIGYEGSTGNSSGAHVHFEVRDNGTAKNPRNYLSSLRWPLDKFTITQEFGLTDYAKQKSGNSCTYGGTWPNNCAIHTGIDIADSLGSPVHAADDGNIILDKYYGGYGNAVIIDHGNNIYSLYGHMLAK